MTEGVHCHNYTPGRRHQKVLGRIGSTVLPFTVTMPQMVTVAAVIPLLLATAPVWSRLAPGVAVVPAVTAAAAWSARYARVEGRNPLWAAIGRLQLWLAPRRGITAGRPTRRPATLVMSGPVPVVKQPADDAAADGSPVVGTWRCLEPA